MDKIYTNSEIMVDVLEGILSDVDRQRMEESTIILERWKSIITSIKSFVNPNCGESMYLHSRILDIKNGIIILQVDHPGYIQLFDTHKKYILKGIRMKIPQMKVENISYRLDKRNDYNTQLDLTREERKRRLEMVEKGESDDAPPKVYENRQYPPELEAIFARIRDSILTNDKEV